MKIARHKVYGLGRVDRIRRYLFECFLKARVGSLLYNFLLEKIREPCIWIFFTVKFMASPISLIAFPNL